MQMGIPKEQLVGHILKDWCSKAHTQSDTFAQAQSELT